MRCLTEAAGSQSSWLRCLITCPGQTLRTAGWSVGSGETSLTGVQCAVSSVLWYPASPGLGMLVEATRPRGITTGGAQARPG